MSKSIRVYQMIVVKMEIDYAAWNNYYTNRLGDCFQRITACSLQQGDQVRIFLSGKRVDIDKIDDPQFNVKGQAQKVLDAGGEFLACGVCLKLCNSGGAEICPLSTLKDQYEVIRDSDKVITV
jgi:hypothetical protein